MSKREQKLASIRSEVRETSSLLAPEPAPEGEPLPDQPRLFSRKRQLHYLYQATHTQTRKEDLEENPQDGHRGVEVFDGQYELKYRLVKDASKQAKQMGIVDRGMNDNYSPLLFGYWSPADESPLGPKQSYWSYFLDTSDLTATKETKDAAFGKTTVISLKRTDGVTAELWLANDLDYFPYKALLHSHDKVSTSTYGITVSKFTKVNGLPIATKASYDQAMFVKGLTVEHQAATLDISNIKINDPHFAIDFALPEGMKFGKYIEGEEQGVFAVKDGKLVKASVEDTPEQEGNRRDSLFLVIGGVGGTALLIGMVAAYRKASKNLDRSTPEVVQSADTP